MDDATAKRRGRPPGAKSAPKEDREPIDITPATCRACGSTDLKVIHSNTQEYGHDWQGMTCTHIVNRKHSCKCGTLTWSKTHEAR